MKKFQWHKPPRPCVTICCGSFNFSSVMTEDYSRCGIYCYDCKQFHDGNPIRLAEVQDFINHGLPMTEKELKETYIGT